MKSALSNVVKQFLKTTTLHGFKYLNSPFLFDRVFWLACSCASACCAGVLCAVVWARFLQTPTLLALADTTADSRAPLVAICPSPQRVANLLAKRLSLNKQQSTKLPAVLKYLIQSKRVPELGLTFLENLLASNNLALTEALLTTAPSCPELIEKCRLQNKMVSCDHLFVKQLTSLGVCCVAEANKLNVKSAKSQSEGDPELHLVLDCSDMSVPNGCQFFTKYRGEEFVSPIVLTTGVMYEAQVTILTVKSSNTDHLLDGGCASDPLHSRQMCQIQCKESICGCSDPLRVVHSHETDVLPPCPLQKINCLRNFKPLEKSCNCAESCKKITTTVSLEWRDMTELNNTFDPITQGIDPETTTTLRVMIQDRGSKVFQLKYTETWFSLLSTLGGVFSMFLGVGLFSAIELIFYIFWRLPATLQRRHNMRV